MGNQQPKRQASKGSKETASTPKRAKKPEKAKSPTPSPPTPPPSTLIFHILFTFPPKNSFPNKSDGDLTDHSFYHSEADSEPTKERRTKKSKAAKEPTSSSGKKKEASTQASKNPSPPPPDGSSPLPHLIPKMSRRSTPRSSKLLVMWLGIY
ncbi:hypothetical protein DSO57_1031288 [Entomophthora muscae]|uniref:Uncharacterized protein n=1 Tax=Entomophthora muscae TaxID=34485 RepID=A0ACC2S2W3_9FUNG|nr:hypothetical protein DSO57_1031288 [Entomophthora muscae]